jgi:hypothetical protein
MIVILNPKGEGPLVLSPEMKMLKRSFALRAQDDKVDENN